MQTLIDNFTHIPDVFPEDSIIGDNKASPAIWESWDVFNAVAEAGKAGDMTAYVAAIKTIGGTCGTCHQQFRIK